MYSWKLILFLLVCVGNSPLCTFSPPMLISAIFKSLFLFVLVVTTLFTHRSFPPIQVLHHTKTITVSLFVCFEGRIKLLASKM